MIYITRALIGLLLFSCSINISGQTIDSAILERFDIRNVGPAGMSGRITSIDVDLSRPWRILAGAASGGVWMSDDGGAAWKPIFNVEETQSVGSVQINQMNPDEIWVGTGEGNPRNSQNSGKGIYKSIDGGKTWKCMGLEETKVIHRIIIDPVDPLTVYAGATGSPWGASEERGVFKTTDGGVTWEKILYVNEHTGVADMVIDPVNHKKLLVAMWEHKRTPWNFTSGGKGSGLYLTFDGGVNWKQLTEKEGLPKGDLGRIGLAYAKSKPGIGYALIEAKDNGLFKTVDGGLTWSLVTKKNIGNRPFYYADIFVDPSNENRIWNLWTYVSVSEDGGRTFKTTLDYGKGVHPDHHAFWQSPDDPNYVIEGNDGGLNISRDGGRNWRFVENIPVGQFYHVNVDMDIPYNLYGGMQDNGSWVGPAYALKNGGIRNADWREVMFGDGFDIMPRRDNNRYGWSMSQGGNLGSFDKETGFTQTSRPVHPDGEELRFNWNSALAQDPFDDMSIYFGSQFVHHSKDGGKSWKIISPDLTTNDTTKQVADVSGGLTIDATQAENHTTILAIAPSPVDRDVVWVGTDDGRLHVTRDGGESWTSLEGRLPGAPDAGWIPQIEISQSDAGEAYVVLNNYRQNDWKAYLYHTENFGDSFQRVADESDIGSFVCSVVADTEEPNLVFLGADDGLYVSFDKAASWQKWPSKSFPAVQVRDMKIHSREHDLVLATFGRAFWVMDDIRPLRKLAAESRATLDSSFAMFEGPDGYLFAYRSVDGVRFTADASFIGDNRRRGARFSYWKKPKDTQDDTKEKDDLEEKDDESTSTEDTEKKPIKKPGKVKFLVIDEAGDTIRTFTHKPKDGLNRIAWNMRRDGVRYPSRSEPKKDQDTPSGRSALPGTYTLVGLYGEHKDSISMVVHYDPRIEVTQEMLASQDASLKEYEDVVVIAYEGFEQLKNARASINTVNAATVNLPDSTQKRIKDEGKKVMKRVDELMKLYMQPEGLKGIQRAPGNLNSQLGSASSYLRRSVGPSGQNGTYAVENAKRELEVTIEAINEFIDTEWSTYTDMVNSTEFTLLKEVQKID